MPKTDANLVAANDCESDELFADRVLLSLMDEVTELAVTAERVRIQIHALARDRGLAH